jgi:hypothetical protein
VLSVGQFAPDDRVSVKRIDVQHVVPPLVDVVVISIYHKNMTAAVSLHICIWRNGPTLWRIE